MVPAFSTQCGAGRTGRGLRACVENLLRGYGPAVAKENYPADWNRKYTDPQLRLRLKDEVVAGEKGGKPGQWSARKAQLLKREYEQAGGGYLGKKDETQQHLSEWSAEDWQTSDGSARARTDAPEEKGGASKGYLPKEAWEELSGSEIKATDAAKAEGSARGEQFVANPEAAAEAGPRGADAQFERWVR